MAEKREAKQGVRITEEEWAGFLAALATCGNVTQSARQVGICRISVYKRLEDDPEFRKAFDRARQLGGEGLEDEARRRGYEGWDEPVFYQGDLVDHVAKFSDTLLIFLLKGIFPEKYKDRQLTEHGGKININHDLDLTKLSTGDLQKIRELLEKAKVDGPQ